MRPRSCASRGGFVERFRAAVRQPGFSSVASGVCWACRHFTAIWPVRRVPCSGPEPGSAPLCSLVACLPPCQGIQAALDATAYSWIQRCGRLPRRTLSVGDRDGTMRFVAAKEFTKNGDSDVADQRRGAPFGAGTSRGPAFSIAPEYRGEGLEADGWHVLRQRTHEGDCAAGQRIRD